MKSIFTLLLILTNTFIVSAQWSNTTNTFYDSLHMPVCTQTGNQVNAMSITSYPDGGTIVFWEDNRNGFSSLTKIYAQKYDKLGNRLWTENGIPVSASTNNQHFTFSSNQDYRNRKFAASDNAGGFYITYADDSIANYQWQRMCVQHIRSDGVGVFSGPGYIEAQTAAGQNYNYAAPQLIGDDDGGFYVAYIKNNTTDYLYVYNEKDQSGVMVRKGGGLVNENGIQKKDPQPCLAAFKYYIYYPVTVVKDYNIWPDLQGNCSIIMSLDGNDGTQRNMLCYNRVWKAKKNAHVVNQTLFPTGGPDTQIIDYAKGDVDILYKLNHMAQNRTCTNPASGVYLWVDDLLTSNGFIAIDEGGYDYNFPKGVTVSTPGNINVEIMATTKRTYSGNTVSNFIVYGIGRSVEKYDTIPFQRGSNSDPFVGYVGAPADLNTINNFRDTLLTEGTYYYDFSLAGGGNQIYTAALMPEPNQGFTARSVYLQHLSVERVSASEFSIGYKTNSNKGELIGKEIGTGFGGNNISYDFPLLTSNTTGNALLSILEAGRYIRVSPVGTGADLLWGAMGKPVGTPFFNGSYYNPLLPFVSLDPADGAGVISWQDTRNLPANTSTNIFMRHLDNLNAVNYLPPNKLVQALINGSTFANPAFLAGSSKKFSTIEAYNNLTSTTSPVVDILDNYNLGAVQVSVYENTAAIRTTGGKPYLNRNYTITPENNPNGAGNINVHFYFTTAQFDALKIADPTIAGPGSLVVIKQPNGTTTVPAEYIPNGSETELTPVSWQAVDGGYYLDVVVTGFSNFFIQKTSAALPVTWLGVQAKWTAVKDAMISWQVADQVNVKDYTVQQSEDGLVFNNACTVTASALTSYNCIVPAKANTTSYYRVLQRDIDNKFTYSKTVILRSAATVSLAIRPNPVKDRLYIEGITGYQRLQVTDMSGKLVQEQNILNGLQYLDISQLGKGMYLLTVTGAKETQTLKFIKQ